jgi:hypothetical protein
MADPDHARPDLLLRLRLDAAAPRLARNHVRLVDSPSPDLRDAVVLLTSEIVARAVEQGATARVDDPLELWVWMPRDVVRVELHGPRALAHVVPGLPPWHFDLMLLDSIADRWSLDSGSEGACFWFEIDRRPARAAVEEGAGAAQPALQR